MNTEIPGWMSLRDLEVLHYIASCVPENGNILEVGPFLGRSTSALLDGKKNNVSLDVVDTFTGISPNAPCSDISGNWGLFTQLRNTAIETGDWETSFKICQGDNLEKMNVFKCASQSFQIEKFYNFTFIDAGHKFQDVYFDINKFINNTGLIAGDDFVPHWPDVIKAVNWFRIYHRKTLIVPRDSKIWILVPNDTYWEDCFNILI